jgi:Fe-S-cluster-containing dehydrogenase component
MIIDLERCYGCDACKAACQEEHMTPPAARFAEVLRAARPGTGWEDETAEGRVFFPLLSP